MINKILLTTVFCGFTASMALANEAVNTISPDDYEEVKATVVNDDPANYTIDVESIWNTDVDQKADYFAVYIASSLPDDCANFKETPINYSKPEKYLRKFDLTDHEDVLNAINEYKCVVIPNKPVE